MDLCLMIEGQEGVTWPQWLALAQACERARDPDPVSLRPLPEPRRAASRARLARRLGHDQRARRGDHDAAARDARLAGELPPPLGAGQARRDRRPRVRRADRSRHRRRLARARARGVRVPVPPDGERDGRARGAAPGPDGPLGRGAVLVRRQALRPVRPRRPAEADPAAASAADHGRQRGPAERGARRPVRRRVQHAVPAARGRRRAPRPDRARPASAPAGIRSRSRP